jgi:hypothetical protein
MPDDLRFLLTIPARMLRGLFTWRALAIAGAIVTYALANAMLS